MSRSKRICPVSKCGKIHKARGYCENHYRSFLKYGDALHVERTRIESIRPRIKELVSQYPGWTLAKIGAEIGVSRQRVHQIVKAETLGPYRTYYKSKHPNVDANVEVYKVKVKS